MSSIPITLDQVVTLGQAYEIIGPAVTCRADCGWNGANQSQLNNHEGSVACQSDVDEFPIVCGKPLIGINPGDGLQVQTHLCQKRFKDEAAAEGHRNQKRLHNQVNKCDECRKVFVVAQTCSEHVRGKDHQIQYTCPDHPTFTGMKSRAAISNHKTRLHSNKTPKLGVCEGCGKENVVVQKGGEIAKGRCNSCAQKLNIERRSVNCGHSDCVGKPAILIDLMDYHNYVHHGQDPIALGLEHVCHNPNCKARKNEHSGRNDKDGRALATASAKDLKRHFNSPGHSECKTYHEAQIAAQKTAKGKGTTGRKRAASPVAGPSGTSKKSK